VRRLRRSGLSKKSIAGPNHDHNEESSAPISRRRRHGSAVILPEHGGFLIAAAIDKYVYITVHQTFIQDLIIKYSSMERVSSVEAIQHPIVREAFKMVEIHETNLEITSMADIPAGTGLGSSGSFTTALLKALHTYRKNIIHPANWRLRPVRLRWTSSVSQSESRISTLPPWGITCFSFNPNGTVEAQPLKMDEEVLHNLEDNLLLFFTGFTRSASQILGIRILEAGGRIRV